MTAKQQTFTDILTSEFNTEKFLRFSKEFFVNLDIIRPDKLMNDYWNWSEFSFHIEGFYHIANFTGNDKAKIAVFAVKLKDYKNIDRARSMQRNFVKKLMSSSGVEGAIVAFFADGEAKWRLSFIKLDYEFAGGKVTEKITPAKRYSYLVGTDEPCHTAMERLYPIFINEASNPNIAEIEEAFSVETVTKQFFEDYKEKYFELKEHLEGNPDFISEATRLHFTSEQFAKKLMGQLAFLYFIQKKGWLGVNAFPKTLTAQEYKQAFHRCGNASRDVLPKAFKQVADDEYRRDTAALDSLTKNEQETLAVAVIGQPWGTGPKNFIRKLFEVCDDKGKDNFFDEYLEPLFYEALNEKRGANDYYHKLNCRVPFLNGGLFEPLDNYDWRNNKFAIPNKMFSDKKTKGSYNATGILDIFDRYNFTMNEDEPLEKEVAVDPEMLGKIFENLLDAKDRKSKGAFYTPREIVHYMCQESLVNYLVNETCISYDAIKDFIVYGEFMRDEDTTREAKQGIGELYISTEILDIKNKVNRLKDIDDALADIRVADPAVGSGAFPLGMISEIVKARRNLTAYFALLTENKAQIRMMYECDRHPLILKLHAIKNSIFAVDIEPSAVDITKLRLWLSLVVEQETNENANDDGIEAVTKNPRPLPNLDCNIRCGNSLIDELDGVKLINESELFGGNNQYQTTVFFIDKYKSLLEELFKTQDKLFFESNHQNKEALQNKIKAIIDRVVMISLEDANPETIEKYNKSKTAASLPYFLWQLEFAKVFKEKGGFDVVIGNPPYLESRHPDFAEKLKNLLQKKVVRDHGKTAKHIPKGADLLIYFFDLSLNLIKKNGINTFITQNSWLDTEYGSCYQDYLLDKCNILGIIDSDFIYFENANINTVITLFEGKTESRKKIVFARCHKNIENYSLSLNATESEESKDVDIAIFEPTDKWLKVSKWGTIFGCQPIILRVINKLNAKGNTLDRIERGNFSIGQGLNLKKSCIVDRHLIDEIGFGTEAYVPFMTNKEMGFLHWKETDNYLILKSKSSAAQIKSLEKLGYQCFDDTKSRKRPPVLILPRGIGARHFCSYNACNGFSASAVDVYSSDGVEITDEIIRLWLFFNSSLCWLLREITGRKNLGGGMLKAEAIDLKSINSYLDICIDEDIRAFFEQVSDLCVENVSLEIKKDYHKTIDKLVYSFLELDEQEIDSIEQQLLQKTTARYLKSATKGI